MSVTITSVGSFYNGEDVTELDVDALNVGDVWVLSIQNDDPSTIPASSVSGGGVPASGEGAWTCLGYYKSTIANVSVELWMGTIATAGDSTISIEEPTGNDIGMACQEFNPSEAVTWSLDGEVATGQGSDVASGNLPSITPANPGELYIADLFGGADPTCSIDYERWWASYAMIAWNLDAVGTQDPAFTQGAADYVAIAACIIATPEISNVTSVFTRTGAVVAEADDYNALQVPNVVASVTPGSPTTTIPIGTGTIFHLFGIAGATEITISGTPQADQPFWIALNDNGTAQDITWDETYFAPTSGSGNVTLPSQTLGSTTATLRVGFVYSSLSGLIEPVGVV